MKLVKIMALAFGLILLVSAAGFAQTSLTTTSATVTIAPNAQTGLVGEVDFSPLVFGSVPTGESLTVTYSAPISSTSDMAVTVTGCNGGLPILPAAFDTDVACAGATGAPIVGSPTVRVHVLDGTQGVVVISFGGPAGSSLGTAPFSIFVRITGVRVNAAAISPAIGSFISALVTNSTGLGTITVNQVPVAQVAEPIAITAATFPLIQQTGGTSLSTVTVSELFPNAFETKGATNPTQIVLTVTPPTGFTFVSTIYTSNLQIGSVVTGFPSGFGSVSSGVIANVRSATSTSITLDIIAQNPSLLDSITVPVEFSAAGPVPLNPGSATVTATLAPPLPANTLVIAVDSTTPGRPLRYAVRTVSVSISFNVGQLQTTLYAVFNVWSDLFNTGFAIGNPTGVVQIPATTTPVAPAKLFFRSAQPGTVQVWLIAMDGTVKTVTTSATVKPGLGLDANGMVPAGGEWAVLLSELAKAAGLTSFQGQVIFVTNFSDAHGVNFIADPDFENQSQGYPMLVVPNANTNDGGVGYNN